jgi:hypothetical protein
MYQVQLTISVEGHQSKCCQGLCCVGMHSCWSNNTGAEETVGMQHGKEVSSGRNRYLVVSERMRYEGIKSQRI